MRSLAVVVLALGLTLGVAVAQTKPGCPGARLAGGVGTGGAALAACRGDGGGDPIRVLLFTKTVSFRHDSIPEAVALMTSLPASEGIRVEATEDAGAFRDENLERFDVVLWVNTTGDVLNDEQQAVMERFIRSGKGFVGVHSAADTEYGWPWYGRLLGAYFVNHPLLPVEVEVTNEDSSHRSTTHLPPTFLFTDEIYNFDRNPRLDHHVLLTVDEEGFIFPNTDGGPSMGDDHPVAWYKQFDGGRSWYTNLGHRKETWADPAFRRHLFEGIRWAASESRWNRIVVTTTPRNPMALEVDADGRVFYVERDGEVRIWDPTTGRADLAARLEVSNVGENGLLGIALAPDFKASATVYLYYSAPDPDGTEPYTADNVGENRLARFRMADRSTLDLTSEEILFRVPSARVQHEGGDLQFGPDGKLYLSLGDNTDPFGDAGLFSPRDKREGRTVYDADRTAGNPFDLRGSILRLNADGTPAAGNLYPADGSQGRPEIFVKGTRNPFRIAVDPSTGRLFWGDVGPDAPIEGVQGPRGYDEINFADTPGVYGWPFCIGFNLPYRDVDFETGEVGDPFSCDGYRPALLAYDYITVDYLALGRAFRATDEKVTGRTALAGVVYRPQGRAPFALPSELEGRLLMTEWTRDLLVSVEVSPGGELGAVERLLPWERFTQPMDLDVGPDGALYVLEFGSGFGGTNSDARLSRIEYSESGDLAPVAFIDATTQPIASDRVTVQLSGARSRAPNDQITDWAWDFDRDGTVDARGAEVEHTFEGEGIYTVALTVTSKSRRRSFPATQDVFVGTGPPTPTIHSPGDGTALRDGVEVQLEGSAVDYDGAPLACNQLVWEVRLGHNSHSHPASEIRSLCKARFTPSLQGHGPGRDLFYVLELSATDPTSGLRAVTTQILPLEAE